MDDQITETGSKPCTQNVNNSNTCLELALEGERLCKSGDFQGGIAFFEAAIGVGTDDLKTLSAIYSQLGNAYFYIGDYAKAMDYHKLDLTVARAIGDRLGEAKASGNLGNSLKMMGRFDEAIICCRRHLEISRDLNDKVGESRALYNLGNVYHSKGKHIAGIGHQDPGEFPEEVRLCLQKAVEYYQDNLKLMTDLGDRLAQGRAYGNLGNTHYLLGNFSQAITFHQERLKLAKEFGDKSAERRAYNNLGNAHIFLGEFESAADFFRRTLTLAEELGDRAVEAQACYSLGNTFTLLRDYNQAVDYHLRHLRIAQELRDKVGESRAYWSLGNAHSAMGSHETALKFANKHLDISKEIGDCSGQVTAQISISDLRKILGFHSLQSTPLTGDKNFLDTDASPSRKNRFRRASMENMDLLKLTPDAHSKDTKSGSENKENVNSQNSAQVSVASNTKDYNNRSSPPKKMATAPPCPSLTSTGGEGDEDNFFDLLSRFQSERMDDQRCDIEILDPRDVPSLIESKNGSETNRKDPFMESRPSCSSDTQYDSSVAESGKSGDDLFELIAGMQSRRMDEQRASLPGLPGLSQPNPDVLQRSISSSNHPQSLGNRENEETAQRNHRMSMDNSCTLPDDDFFDMLMRCQSTRIEDQRSSMPNLLQSNHHPMLSNSLSTGASSSSGRGGTVNSLSGSAVAGPSSTAIRLNNNNRPAAGSTVPDDDFFTLILRFQGGRIEEQRSTLPAYKSGPSSAGGSLGRERILGGSLRTNRTPTASLLKSSLKQGKTGGRLHK